MSKVWGSKLNESNTQLLKSCSAFKIFRWACLPHCNLGSRAQKNKCPGSHLTFWFLIPAHQVSLCIWLLDFASWVTLSTGTQVGPSISYQEAGKCKQGTVFILHVIPVSLKPIFCIPHKNTYVKSRSQGGHVGWGCILTWYQPVAAHGDLFCAQICKQCWQATYLQSIVLLADLCNPSH